MKSTIYTILACTLILSGCERMSPGDMSVRKYIRLLKSESYDFIYLPSFGSEDIPELLTYASEERVLKSYPKNPISSFIGGDCRLGVFVLWTVESIRITSIEGRTTFGRFPSLNPVLASKIPGDNTVDPEKSHAAAVQAYLDWWNSGDFSEIKNIDPLESTAYHWR